jgi:dipeptidyl aminopeptidase/acylaminoacyl peptidase
MPVRLARLAAASLLVAITAPAQTPRGAAPGPLDSGAIIREGRPLAIEDFYRIRTPGAPQVSADGRWIAFTVTSRDEATNRDPSEVWLAAADASTPARRVSPANTSATAPRWEADGSLRFRAERREFSLMPASEQLREAPIPAPSTDATVLVAPNGVDRAILRAIRPAVAPREFASEFEKRHEERFKGRQFDWLDFQRDGQDYPVPDRTDPVSTPVQEIFLANGGAERQLSRLGLRPANLAWHPSGDRLVFTADSGYRDERRYGASQVYTITTAGVLANLTRDPDHHHNGARFSPDGRWVLYTKQLSTNTVIARKLDHGGATDLAIRPAAGGAERLLTAEWDLLPGDAQWSPDSRFVYFTGGIGGATHLFRVPATGGAVEQVTRGERRVQSPDFDRDFTRIAYTVGRIEGPSDVFTAKIDGSEERRITRLNESLEREVAFSTAERLRFASADGTMLEGWLLPPFGFRAGAPASSASSPAPSSSTPAAATYPLVVVNHGGPHSADGYAFDFRAQYFAARGYFVLKVNFRSSTGYGERFLWATWGAWGDKDGEDVMAGVDHVIARFPVDARRVATMGHSYGGFMTNWLITQYPDRFAAAISGAGIVNWVSDYGTADIARTKETEFYGPPWDARARAIMIKQSPLTYADRAKAPTLFIHGEVDERVPYSEAEQMFVALRKNGVPARMVQYEGMFHGITGSWNNIHRMLTERRWLDEYLMKGRTM